MNKPYIEASGLPRDLGDGLLLRRSTAADAEPLAEFNRWIHRDPGVTEPDEGVAEWTRDLLDGNHPTFGEGDFTVVVEKDSGRIVSAMNLISQTWSYAGVPFGVGRIELVGTATEYRKRGLVRAQFEEVHRWSAARGELVQGITGIPFYYRQFGYEMALSLAGGRICQLKAVPVIKEGQAEAFVLRPCLESDLPFIMELDAYTAPQSLINLVRDETLWRYEMFGRRPGNVNRIEFRIVQHHTGERAGLVGFMPIPWAGHQLGVLWVSLAEGWSYVEAAASILRGLKTEAEAVGSAKGKMLDSIYFALGDSHPFYAANHDRLAIHRLPYAWYIRVPDLPAFVRTIAPALEQRLASSWAAGHTGGLKISFYRLGLRLEFRRGRLVTVEPWEPVIKDDEGDVAFPGLPFLQMLFGYRDFAELRNIYADVWAGSDEARGLIEALFPRVRTRFVGHV